MKYLIIRNDGIGDLIVSTPVIETIRINDKKSKIYLISSYRNHEYAKILQNDGLIDYLYVLSGNKVKSYLSLINELSDLHFEYVLILKASTSSLLFAKFIKSKSIFSIVSINQYQNKVKRYSPPSILNKFLLNGHEYIDCRNNYENSKDVHMSSHYLNLIINLYEDIEVDHNRDYYSSPYLKLEGEKYHDNLNNHYKINTNRVIMFHFDEKWDDYNDQPKKLIQFINKLQIKTNATIFISNGIAKNKFESYLFKSYEFQRKEESKNIFQSDKNKKIFFFDKLKIDKLFYLAKLSDLIITPHGALTHISSIYKVNIIDLISLKKKFFFNKWKSVNNNNVQFDISDLEKVLRKTVEYLKIKF
jgi:ADP-heptose:LPS heptosyltransferase